MTAPTMPLACAGGCPLVNSLAFALARSKGVPESVVHLGWGIPARASPEPPAVVAAQLRALAPATDPQGWLSAVAHYLTHPPTGERPWPPSE